MSGDEEVPANGKQRESTPPPHSNGLNLSWMPTTATAALDRIAGLTTTGAVADLLEVNSRHIARLLAEQQRDELYYEFLVPKRTSGFRTIAAPRADLKAVQRRLAVVLGEVYVPRDSAHGFVRERSIATNARVHVRKRHVLNVDLKDFFGSIHIGRVIGLFRRLGVPDRGASILARLCTHKGVLPQGAPTSPVLSNMICFKLDRQLQRLAKDFGAYYTRYADDITFSRRRSMLPPEIAFMDDGRAKVGEFLERRILANGFTINREKVWLYDNRHRQVVTGVVVNSRTNVDRRFIRNIRAMIHACQKYGIEQAQIEHARRHRGESNNSEPNILSVIRGRIEFLSMLRGKNDPVVRNLQRRFAKVDLSYLDVIKKEVALLSQRDLFISHAGEDKDTIARPLADALTLEGFSVWFDEYDIRLGDSLRGKIDEGLRQSKFGVLVLSPHFFKKRYPRIEFEGLDAMEDIEGRRRILPIWHGVDRSDVAEFSPPLAGIRAVSSATHSLDQIVGAIAEVIRSPS